jgi:hypothetical protein
MPIATTQTPPLLAQQQQSPMGQQAPSMDMLAQMSPDQRQMYASLGALDDENQSVEGQLAQARAIRGHTFQEPRNTVGAATMGGIADIINSIRAGTQEKEALERQKGIRQEQTHGRDAMMDAYVNALRGQQAQAQQPSAPGRPSSAPPPPDSFLSGLGFGG